MLLCFNCIGSAIRKVTHFSKAVLKVINLGNETDTNNAITGSLARVHYGFDNELVFWKIQLARFEDIEALIKQFVEKLAE